MSQGLTSGWVEVSKKLFHTSVSQDPHPNPHSNLETDLESNRSPETSASPCSIRRRSLPSMLTNTRTLTLRNTFQRSDSNDGQELNSGLAESNVNR